MTIEQETNSRLLNTNDLFKLISSHISKHSITQWDLGASSVEDSSVQVDKGEPKQLKASQRNSLTIRVWNKEGLVGVTSTSDLSNNGLAKAIKGSYEASFFGNPEDIPQFSPLAKSQLSDLHRPLKDGVGISRMLSILQEAESKLISKHKAINSVPYNGLSESKYQKIYLNSEGACRDILRTQASLYLYSKAEESGRKPRSSGSVRLSHGTIDLDIDGCIEEAAKRTISHLNYNSIDTGRYLVCFMPEAFLELMGAFSTMFNARSILDGVSLSKKDSIGEKIAPEFFCLSDNGLHPENIGAISFDGEGTPTKHLSIVENGIIRSFLHSESTARTFGVQPTGHAGLGSKVSVGYDWFEVSKDTNTKYVHNLEHSNTKDRFILIEGLSALHAGVKASQGSFSLPFDGWLFIDGEPVSIEAATVAGDIKDVLKNIICLEDEEVVTPNGVSPYVWVEGLSITGEA